MTRVHRAAGRGPFTALVGLALVFTGAQVIASPPAAANPAGTHLVINEYSGGNGTGTAATDEYVELYNPTDATITFTGTIQYKSAAGSTYTAVGPVTNFVVPARGYWLIAGINYSGVAVPDSRYSFDGSASTTGGGHIALTGATTGVTTPASDPLRVDLLGFGTANTPEGTAAPAHPPAGGSLRRTNAIDTDNNSADFIQVATRSPRSSTSTATTITDPGAQVYPINQSISPVTVTAAGGRAPYTYAISSGSLPTGLTLNSSTGEISGTPSSARAAESVTVRATDANGDPVYSTFSITVVDGGAAPLTLASPGSKSFVLGTPITPFTMSASGGVGPYTYAVSAGLLLDGLTLDPDTGEISGTPTVGGSSVVEVTVTDSASGSARASFTVDVYLGTLTAVVPTIDDTTPVVGDVLAASAGTWGPAPVALAYQWLADGDVIDGADESTFEVTDDQVGAVLSVRVSGTKSGYQAASRVSAETSAVVASVTVTGPGSKAFTVGVPVTPFTLAVSGGVAPYTFEVTDGVLPAGVELDADSGEIAGTPTAAAAASSVEVTATDDDGNTGSTTFSVSVGLGALAAVVPTIDDTTPVVGDVLAASAGTWGPAPVALAYQWLADGDVIDGADESTFEVTDDQVGAVLSVRVSGTKSGYLAASRVSVETAAVVAPVTVTSPGSKAFTVGSVITPFTLAVSGGVAPYTYEVTAGTLPAGVELDADSGEIAGTPTAAAAASSVEVTATDDDGNVGSTSFSVSVGLGALTAVVPTIDDTTPVVGDVLTASAGTWGPAPVALAYQWLADGVEIDGADESTFEVTDDEVGAVLSVRVSGTKSGYLAASRVSAETSAVVASVTVTSPGSKAFTVGVPVTPFTLAVSGGVAPYTFEVTDGTLPGGITLNASTGQVSGTPTTAAAASNVEVTATDDDGNTGSTTFSVTVDAAPSTGAPGAGDPQPTPITPTPIAPTPIAPTPVKPNVDIRMKPVDRRPEHRVRMRILVDGVAVTGSVRIQVGDRKVRTRVVDGIVRLRPAQITKLVVKPKAPGATPPKPAAKPRPKYRHRRAVVRYRGLSAAPVSAPFTIRVTRLHR